MAQSVDELIERVRTVPANRAGDKRLASMLRQNASHFIGLSAGETDKVRGHILASFEHRTLSTEAFDAVKEELRTSFSPIVLAGAARAIRGRPSVDLECRDLLVAASERMEVRDEVVRLEERDHGPTETRTARGEIALTLAFWQEPAKSCCGGAVASATVLDDPQTITLCPSALGQIAVEDQSEQCTALLDLLKHRTSLIAFFYTRCMNPVKCSQTISRLGDLGRLASAHPWAANLNVLAITYDADFDSPSRLHVFGRDRGFPFGRNAKLLRCTKGWERVRRMFDLQVGYGATTVNAHARELFIVSDRLQAIAIACEQLSKPVPLLARLREASMPTR